MKTAQRMAGAGFTLLELLVVMALLSLLMLGTVSALRGTAQIETRVDARIERADDMRLLQAFLSQLSCCVLGERARLVATDAPALLFEGAPDHMAWVGIMPARVGLGGQYFLSLRVQSRPEGDADLVLRYHPFEGERDWPDWERAEQQTLLARVNNLSLRFEDLREPIVTWVDHWPDASHLPARVEVLVNEGENDELAFRFSLRPLPSRGQGDGDFGIGGSQP